MAQAWKDDLGTGLQIIDTQHRELLARVDKLITACIEGSDPAIYVKTFEFLRVYVTYHFGTEERLMDDNHFPQVEFHKGQHRWYEAEIDRIHAEIREKGLNASSQMRYVYLLVDWFGNHIHGVDRKLTGFLKEKSAEPPPAP